MECCICFGEEENNIKCRNCNSSICFECMNHYIKSCSTELNTLPICPNTKCKSEYIYKDLKISEEVLSNYCDLLITYMTDNVNFENNNKNLDNIMDNLMKEKREFIKQKFPKCVSKVIKVCMKNKLRNLPQVKIKREMSKYKKCFNDFCKVGCLNLNNNLLECNFCQDIFCPDCQKKVIPKEKHICNKDEIESLKFVNNLVKCPECHIRVEKSEGCDSITCTNCKTNFTYSNGEKGGHGSHNAILKERKNIKFKFSEEYKYEEKIMLLLNFIDNTKPKKLSSSKVLSIFEKVSEENKVKLFKEYSKYYIHKTNIKKYCEKLIKIKELHEKNEIKYEKLEEIYEEIKILCM